MSFQTTNDLRLLLKKRIDKLDTGNDLEFYRHLKFFGSLLTVNPSVLELLNR
jgi:hypothetical protein